MNMLMQVYTITKKVKVFYLFKLTLEENSDEMNHRMCMSPYTHICVLRINKKASSGGTHQTSNESYINSLLRVSKLT